MIRIHFLCLAFLGLVAHISGKELYKSVREVEEGRREEEVGREGGSDREGNCVLSLFN